MEAPIATAAGAVVALGAEVSVVVGLAEVVADLAAAVPRVVGNGVGHEFNE